MVSSGSQKYQNFHNWAKPLPEHFLRELNNRRRSYFINDMVGHDPKRYDEVAFGNVSMRLESDFKSERKFAITGTNTGKIPFLSNYHYAVILKVLANLNSVLSEGPTRPSSECMTHDIVYELVPEANFVFHPHFWGWKLFKYLDLPTTKEGVDFGTPEMREEFEKLLYYPEVRKNGIIIMGGHEDGVVTWGKTAEEAERRMKNYVGLCEKIVRQLYSSLTLPEIVDKLHYEMREPLEVTPEKKLIVASI